MERKIKRKTIEELEAKKESSKIIFKESIKNNLDAEINVSEKYSVSIDGRSGVLDETIILREFESEEGRFRPEYQDIQELVAILQGGMEALNELEDFWIDPRNKN
jgi:hypothetical protein